MVGRSHHPPLRCRKPASSVPRRAGPPDPGNRDQVGGPTLGDGTSFARLSLDDAPTGAPRRTVNTAPPKGSRAEALHPARGSLTTLAHIRRTIGEYNFAGQY